MILILSTPLKQYFSEKRPSEIFDMIMGLQGKVFRSLQKRKTIRVKIGNQIYFVKKHFGVGWKEVFKNLFQFRLPVFGAKNEFLAIKKLAKLGVPAVKFSGYGKKGINLATQKSFIITEELKQTESLESFCKNWKKNPPTFHLKQRLIEQVAYIARKLHNNGVNHRDFYLCHFMFNPKKLESIKLYLMDLHRVQIRKNTPQRWKIKDIAGLYFSSMDIGLTQYDIFRFLKSYFQLPLREIFSQHERFLSRVSRRAIKLYKKHWK